MLPEEINGEVTCRQQLPLSHPAGIFSSKLPINVTAVIYDNFIKPQFNFTWIIDGNILTSTTEPNYAFQLRKAREDLTVHVRIQARVHLPMSQLLVIRSANFRNFISTKGMVISSPGDFFKYVQYFYSRASDRFR